MKSGEELFSTQDIPICAYLHARGHQIIEQSVDSSHMTFAFRKSKNLLEDLYNYENNSPIPVRDFYKSLSKVWFLIKETRANG